MFSGKREKALLEEELAALRETEKRERELLHKIAGQKDTAEEQFARMTASRAQMEKEIEEIEQQMQQNGELSENGAQAAGELHNTLITMNNGIATFDANHSVFMEQVKGQNEKVVEIVENNKHFTTPMKHISEAPQALREMRQALGERAERMEELSKTMGVLALNSAIEAGRMGESGTRFVTAAEQVRAYADDYEQEALALKDQLGEAEERIASLEEQVHHLNELLKENNISIDVYKRQKWNSTKHSYKSYLHGGRSVQQKEKWSCKQYTLRQKRMDLCQRAESRDCNSITGTVGESTGNQRSQKE